MYSSFGGMCIGGVCWCRRAHIVQAVGVPCGADCAEYVVLSVSGAWCVVCGVWFKMCGVHGVFVRCDQFCVLSDWSTLCIV